MIASLPAASARRLAASLGILIAIVLASCSTGTHPTPARPETNPQPSGPAGGAAGAPTVTPVPTGALEASATDCPVSGPGSTPTLGVLPHQDPQIEAALPAAVAGRSLTRWSIRGLCVLQFAFRPSDINTVLQQFTTAANPNPVSDSSLVYAVDGRTDVSRDPPYFVYATVHPANDDETSLVTYLLAGLAGFYEPARVSDPRQYTEATVGGKDVYVGSTSLLKQDVHQRGRPYLYDSSAGYIFLVITDNDAWAADALRQLP